MTCVFIRSDPIADAGRQRYSILLVEYCDETQRCDTMNESIVADDENESYCHHHRCCCWHRQYVENDNKN